MKAKIFIFFLHFISFFSLSSLRKAGTVLGACCWLVPSRMMRITRINLKLCFPELDHTARELLGKKSVQETCKTFLEMGPAWLWPREKILKSIQKVEGFQVIQEAYSHKKGVIMIIPHLGNWELLNLYMGDSGLGKINGMYQAPKSQAVDKLIFSARSRGGTTLAATDNRGVVTVLTALRRGEILGILPDQVPPLSGGEHVLFFGQEALTMTLLSRLLKKTGARAVLAYARRINGAKGEGFKIVFKEIKGNIYAEHMPDSVQAMNDAIEDVVREVPEQYQWEYKRFKRQSEGKPNLY